MCTNKIKGVGQWQGEGGAISLKMQIEAVKLQKPKNRTQKSHFGFVRGFCFSAFSHLSYGQKCLHLWWCL